MLRADLSVRSQRNGPFHAGGALPQIGVLARCAGRGNIGHAIGKILELTLSDSDAFNCIVALQSFAEASYQPNGPVRDFLSRIQSPGLPVIAAQRPVLDPNFGVGA